MRSSATPKSAKPAAVSTETWARVNTHFASRGWSPFEFQIEAWQAYLDGYSGLINAPTGVGKTMAAWMGCVIEGLQTAISEIQALPSGPGKRKAAAHGPPLTALWLTPLRALAADTTSALLEPVTELGLGWTVQMRTGDSPQSVKLKQKERLPTALVTTPESLTLLLSYPDYRERFQSLKLVVVDEWHELMGTKRGVQVELALARLRRAAPAMRTWGVSATLGNLEQARDVLLGPGIEPSRAKMVRGTNPKVLDIQTMCPSDIERFPWAGHLGVRMAGDVIKAIMRPDVRSTLLFTNTRAQAEMWFGRLLTESPDLVGQLAIHHGSLDRKLRTKVEGLLADGRLKCVVCTSSLDLGVDFSPVDQVLQIGSPKGIARLMQRAGRSGHRPGAPSRVIGVPTHALEVLEFAAARGAAERGEIESRPPLIAPLDCLAQHVVTMACAAGTAGFDRADLLQEIRTTHAYAAISDDEWTWVMDFVLRGGPALKAYPHFARVKPIDGSGQEGADRYTIATDRLARMHRMTIGTISSETSMSVRYLSGKTIGTIEESFVARLTVGQKFVLAGKVLELLRVKDMTAFVQRARSSGGIVPRWDGGRFSLSTQLAAAVRGLIDEARQGRFASREMQTIRPLLELQCRWSILPSADELLVESLETDDAYNVFIFPFEGRMVHEGLGALLAHRLTRRSPLSITATCNDYGVVLRCPDPFALGEEELRSMLSTAELVEDLSACMNSSGLARRQFRDISRVAGLVVPGFPGSRAPTRHLQASTEMFYDVFEEFDPHNMLMLQAKREVLHGQLELGRLKGAMERIQKQQMRLISPTLLTPLAFPLWAEHLRSTSVSSEKFSSIVAKTVLELEECASTGRARSPGKTAKGTLRRDLGTDRLRAKTSSAKAATIGEPGGESGGKSGAADAEAPRPFPKRRMQRGRPRMGW